jgi:hypothetical protein
MKNAITFNCVHAEKESSRTFERNGSEYPFDLFIDEVRRMGDTKAIVTFTLRSSTRLGAASFHVAGEMMLQGSRDEVSSAISSSGKEPPLIWKSIYDESHSLLVTLAKMIGVPFPTSSRS